MIYNPQSFECYSLKQRGFHDGETLERLGITVEAVSPRRIARTVEIMASLILSFFSFLQYLQWQ